MPDGSSAGRLAGRRVLLFQGRSHYYETGDAGAMRVPVGLARALGIPTLVLTNAAGSVRPDIRPGSLVAIADHINLSGANPLLGTGRKPLRLAHRCLRSGLREALQRAAERIELALAGGRLCLVLRPELRNAGRDPHGAHPRRRRRRHVDGAGGDPRPLLRPEGRRDLVVTNLAAGIEGASPSHQETKDIAAEASARFKHLIRAFLAELPVG